MVTQHASKKKMSLAKKLMLGFAGLTTAAVVGTAGVAAAQTSDNTGALPTSKAECKERWEDFGFRNQGQCIKWWNQQQHGGNGYGNGNNNQVDTTVNLDVSGDNNVIEIALNYVFGRD
jgi:hypothetical protein